MVNELRSSVWTVSKAVGRLGRWRDGASFTGTLTRSSLVGSVTLLL